MSPRREHYAYSHAVVVVADRTVRTSIEQACRAAGASVLGVGSIADLERWPVRQIVITDAAHCTPWWQTIGAGEVVVLARNAEEGVASLTNGATRWLRHPLSSEAVTAMVIALRRS
jgi:hypothetical protein